MLFSILQLFPDIRATFLEAAVSNKYKSKFIMTSTFASTAEATRFLSSDSICVSQISEFSAPSLRCEFSTIRSLMLFSPAIIILALIINIWKLIQTSKMMQGIKSLA